MHFRPPISGGPCLHLPETLTLILTFLQDQGAVLNAARSSNSTHSCNCDREAWTEEHELGIQALSSDPSTRVSLTMVLAVLRKRRGVASDVEAGMQWSLDTHEATAMVVNFGLWWWCASYTCASHTRLHTAAIPTMPQFQLAHVLCLKWQPVICTPHVVLNNCTTIRQTKRLVCGVLHSELNDRSWQSPCQLGMRPRATKTEELTGSGICQQCFITNSSAEPVAT